MIVATYNAAGIRARMPVLLDWMAENEPDVIGIQETKVEDDRFPREPFEDLGYHLAIHGQKGFNGVAILAKLPITNITCGFEDPLYPDDARIIAAEVAGVTIVNTYVPNGTALGTDKFAYKLCWLERFAAFLKQRFRPEQPLLWMGDINIAPTDLDVFEPARHRGRVCFHPDEHARLATILDFGLTDLFRLHNAEGGCYTYWEFTIPTALDRNLGWRIDHIYGTQAATARCSRSWIDREARSSVRPSDHTFMLAELSE